MFAPQFQILSDIHLETPLTTPSYTKYHPQIHASNLLLLGDIGLAKDSGLFHFLRTLLSSTPNLRIFYILGNHEPYHLSFPQAITKLQHFETEVSPEFGNRFIFLHRTRYDVNDTVTILGCTLWSRIDEVQAKEVCNRLTDFNEVRGIRGWGLDEHMAEHQKDVEWLNSQVKELGEREPQRQIIIATHHCPTIDVRAVDPKHRNSPISSGFMTDLSREPCWTSPAVKLWAFGHTHYSCVFYEGDDGGGKLVVANQGGYRGMDAAGEGVRQVVIEAGVGAWKVVYMDQLREDRGREKGRKVKGKHRKPGKDKKDLTPPKVSSRKSVFRSLLARLKDYSASKKMK